MALLWNAAEGHALLHEDDVTAAHIGAPHVLQLWLSFDARKWRRMSLDLVLGAAIPVFGYFALAWAPALVLFGLALDVWMIVFCDGVRRWLAGQRVLQEQAHLDEAARIRAVIHALRRPRRLLLMRDLTAPPPPKRYYLSMPEPARGRTAEWTMAGLFIALASFVLLLSWLSLGATKTPIGCMEFALFGAGALLRLVVCVLETRRWRDDPTPRPELLSQGLVPLLALIGSFPSMIALHALFESVFGDELSRSFTIGLGVLAYFLLCVGFGLLGLHNVRTLLREMRIFAAQDRERLRERVRRVNGAGIGDSGLEIR